MAATALEKHTHPGAGAMERAPECGPGPPGPQSLARPRLVPAEFGDTRSTGPPHPNTQGQPYRTVRHDMSLCLLEHPLSHLPPTPPQGLSEEACCVTLPPWAFLSNSAGWMAAQRLLETFCPGRPQADPESTGAPHPGNLLLILPGPGEVRGARVSGRPGWGV